MKSRDIVIGILILLLIGGVVYWRQSTSNQQEQEEEGETLSVEESLEERFQIDIPEGVDRAELQDQTGGSATGIATRDFQEATFSHSLIADLPDPEQGRFYQGWLVRGEEGDENFDIVSTGRFSIAKGGWSLEFKSGTDYSDYGKVWVTSEESQDSTPEEVVLEGSF